MSWPRRGPPPGKTGCSPAGSTSGCARPEPARITACRSPTGLSSPLFTCRFQLPHAALAELYRVHRSTVTRAVGEVRPLLAARGFAVPGQPGVRLRTLADVFAYAAALGVTLRLDGTEVQVRRPRAGKPGRRAFVSGKKKMNTKKATVITERRAAPCGPGLWGRADALPDRGADRGHRRPVHPAPAGQGQSRRRRTAAWPDSSRTKDPAPPLKPKKDAAPEENLAYAEQRHQQSSERSCVEHANAEHKQWRVLQRFLGRRDDFDETYLAVACLVSDRAAER